MKEQLLTSVLMFAILSVITGIGYPFVCTVIGQSVFPRQANGSLILSLKSGNPIGSELLGQEFSSDNYFWSRPSSTSEFPYNAAASSGSNLSPTNPTHLNLVQTRISRLQDKHASQEKRLIPVDLVTASASGLDPHISVLSAQYQIERVAINRKAKVSEIKKLVDKNVELPLLGFLGEPRVNVLRLNLALDQMSNDNDK